MAMHVLTPQEARNQIEKLNPNGWFQSDGFVYCKGRTDVCAVIRHEENGFDSLFLVWKNWEGKTKTLRIGSYKSKSSFLTIKEFIKTRTQIVIEVYNGNSRFGSFWVPLKKLDLKDSFS